MDPCIPPGSPAPLHASGLWCGDVSAWETGQAATVPVCPQRCCRAEETGSGSVIGAFLGSSFGTGFAVGSLRVCTCLLIPALQSVPVTEL